MSTQRATDVDVVIVGAGAAGLAAARRAGELGLAYAVFEAMDRIGGRAHTETSTFGVPWDRGCHWLHSANVNPMRELADRYGFRYYAEQPPFRYYHSTGPASAEEMQRIQAYVDGCWETVEAAGRAGQDIAAIDLLDASHPWFPIVRTGFAGEWSVAVEEVSSADDAAYRDTDHNWPVEDGYGALVARHAEGIPVELSSPVERIEWGGPRVRVTTPVGTIEAGAVVVTVSTRIIQDGVIAFDPPLPVWKQAAYDAIRLGNANKVTFAIDGRLLGVGGHAGMWSQVTERQGMFFQLRPFGWDMASGFLAGELGAEAERDGPAAMIATGLTALKNAYGSRIERQVRRAAVSTWQTDPYIRGAYGMARPGQAHKRKELVTPVDGRLFWAGEAVSHDWFSTCHGAHLTGIDAAEAVAKVLGKTTSGAVGE